MSGKASPKMNGGGEERGFTLIELIIVMAILALLAALTVPKFAGVLKYKDEDVDKANLKMLQTAVELYMVEEGEYPSELEILLDNYISELPDPLQAGKEFKYSPGNGKVSLGNKTAGNNGK